MQGWSTKRMPPKRTPRKPRENELKVLERLHLSPRWVNASYDMLKIYGTILWTRDDGASGCCEVSFSDSGSDSERDSSIGCYSGD